MRERVLSCLAWVVLAAVVAMSVIGATYLRRGVSADDVFGIPFFAFAIVGAVVASRQPKNPVGWIFLFVGFSPTVGYFTSVYAYRSILTEGGLPGARVLEWISSYAWFPGIGALITFGLLLFPDGKVPSRRFRFVPYLAGALMAFVTFSIAFKPGPMEPFDPSLPSSRNPYGLEGARALMETLEGLSFSFVPVVGLICAFSLFVRFRRASVEQRQQIKWFAYSAVMLLVIMMFELPIQALLGESVSELVFLVGMTFPSVGAGIGILKYRLFDIDVVINRTLVYGLLTAMLALLYLGLVVALQQVLGGFATDSDLAVAASTLVVAALFRPLRARIQAFIDHRFYRRKYDAAATLERFSSRLRDQVDLDAVNSQVLRVVTETVQPAHASVWLRPRTGS